MKKVVTSICILLLCLVPLMKTELYRVSFGQEEYEDGAEREDGVDKEMAYLYYSRAYPDPYYLNDKWMKAWEQMKELRKRKIPGFDNTRINGAGWNNIPDNLQIGGRILCIAFNPLSASTMYAGSAGGGIWKSTNSGGAWAHVSTDFPVLGVTSILVHPANPDIIYAATGEVYRYDSTGSSPNPNNQGYNVWKARGTFSVGILKTIDGGTSWSQVFTRSMANMFGIQMLKFDPNDANTIYACCTDGLYRTTDAGANWVKILNLTYISDVVINKANSNQIVAAVGNLFNTVKGIFRSTDGGNSWTKITSGLPASFQGFIRMDNLTSSGNENKIVASIGVCESCTGTEIYKSGDFGNTWTGISGTQHTQWQYWCAHDVAIDPSSPNDYIYGGVGLYSSSGTIGSAHDDIHDIKFDLSNSSNIFIACDGGIYKSTDGGISFNKSNNGLNATQFYASLGVSATSNYFVGGLQDNGVVQYNGSSWSRFPNLGGTDGASCLVNPGTEQKVVASGDARDVYYSSNKGSTSSAALGYLGKVADSRTAFVSPMAQSKRNPALVYVGSDNLHRSTNSGASFNNATSSTGSIGSSYLEAQHKTAVTMAVSPSDPNGDTLWVSTSPFAQYDNDADNIYINGSPNFFVVQNAATVNTYPLTSDPKTKNVMAGLPDRFVMDIAISPTYPDSVFIVLGGFGTSHVYVTPDRGTTWTAIGSGLPDVPFNAILIDPVNPKVLYAGSDMGVFVSPDRGLNWYDFNTGFADAVQIMDIQATYNNNLVVATHGQGAFMSARFSGILPVHLISFTGEALPNYNKLQWQVSDEVNMSRYELEKSSDGSNFKKTLSIPSGNNPLLSTYTYNDPVTGNGSFYYRLKSVNMDESYLYSEVICIRRNSKERLEVLGNPFGSEIHLKLVLAVSGMAHLSLYNSAGQLIRKEQFMLSNGENDLSIGNISGLSSGIYYLEAIVGHQRWKQRLLKNK